MLLRSTKPNLWSLDDSHDLMWLSVGTAMGVGNFLYLPSVVVFQAGGWALALHVLSLVLLAAPLVLAELLWGRWMLRPFVESYRVLGEKWAWVPFLSMAAIVFLLPSYFVDVGRLGALTLETLTHEGAPPTGLRAQLESSPMRAFLGALSLLFFCAGSVWGSSRSMASTLKFLMKLVLPLWAILVFFTFRDWGYMGLHRILAWRPHELNWSLVLHICSFSLFSLSAGFGIYFTYVYYASQVSYRSSGVRGEDPFWKRPGALVRVLGAVITGDVLASCVSLILVSPYGYGAIGNGVKYHPSSELILDWVPQLFIRREGGSWLVAAYFVSLFAAGAAAAISLFDCLVFQIEREMKWPRSKAVLHTWALCVGLIILPLLPFFRWVMDFVGSEVLLPLAALFLCYGVGWRMPLAAQRQIIGRGLLLDRFFFIWRFSLRYLVPAFLVYILLK